MSAPGAAASADAEADAEADAAPDPTGAGGALVVVFDVAEALAVFFAEDAPPDVFEVALAEPAVLVPSSQADKKAITMNAEQIFFMALA